MSTHPKDFQKKKESKMKKLIAILLAAVLAVTLALPAFAAGNAGAARSRAGRAYAKAAGAKSAKSPLSTKKTAKTSNKNTLKVLAISDTHFLARELIKATDDYHAAKSMDKMFTESDSILDAELDRVKKENSDVLLVTGDLTKDGELEGHRAFARKLRTLKKQMPKLKVYVIPGNHDIRNKNAYNFNTADGKKVPATRTEPQDFYNTYKDISFDDPSVIAKFTPAAGRQAGQLSYAARPKKGFTIINMDSCRYSADNTTNGKDEHETSGAISKDLEQWVLRQIAEGRKRGDFVIGVMHHTIVPHFTMESTAAPEYMLADYQRISQEFADAGMHFCFTGHYHAQDVSKMQTPKGNDLFDLETGASCAYPVPIRQVIFTRGSKTETAQGSTVDHMPVKLVNPETGKTENIPDISTYARKNDLSAEQIKGMCDNYVGGYLTEHNIPYDGAVKSSLYKVIDDVTEIPVSKDNHHILDLIVYARRAHQGGTDSKENIPAWFQEGATQIKDGTLVYDALNILLRDVRNLPKDIAAAALNSVIPAQDHDLVDRILAAKPGEKQILDAKTAKEVNNFLYDLLYSYVDDENYPDDREFNIVLTDRGNGVMNDGKPVASPADSTHKDEDLYKFVNTVINKIASGK